MSLQEEDPHALLKAHGWDRRRGPGFPNTYKYQGQQGAIVLHKDQGHFIHVRPTSPQHTGQRSGVPENVKYPLTELPEFLHRHKAEKEADQKVKDETHKLLHAHGWEKQGSSLVYIHPRTPKEQIHITDEADPDDPHLPNTKWWGYKYEDKRPWGQSVPKRSLLSLSKFLDKHEERLAEEETDRAEEDARKVLNKHEWRQSDYSYGVGGYSHSKKPKETISVNGEEGVFSHHWVVGPGPKGIQRLAEDRPLKELPNYLQKIHKTKPKP